MFTIITLIPNARYTIYVDSIKKLINNVVISFSCPIIFFMSLGDKKNQNSAVDLLEPRGRNKLLLDILIRVVSGKNLLSHSISFMHVIQLQVIGNTHE